MNTTINGIIKQKAKIVQVYKSENAVNLCGLREENETIYLCSHAGEILQLSDNGEVKVYSTIKGQPNSKYLIIFQV
jgi:hypothetical protein